MPRKLNNISSKPNCLLASSRHMLDVSDMYLLNILQMSMLMLVGTRIWRPLVCAGATWYMSKMLSPSILLSMAS